LDADPTVSDISSFNDDELEDKAPNANTNPSGVELLNDSELLLLLLSSINAKLHLLLLLMLLLLLTVSLAKDLEEQLLLLTIDTLSGEE